jgi:hypothetical protein
MAVDPLWFTRRGGREAGAEFTGGEGIQGAEAGGKLDVGQAALAMQPPEKICRGEIVFREVALLTAGNQVAPGIVPELCKRDDVIQAAGCGGNAAQAIKAAPAFSGVNGPAQPRGFQEVEIVAIECARTACGAAGNLAWASRGNLVGDAYLDHVTHPVALHQAQDAVRDQAAHSLAYGLRGKVRTTSEPGEGKLEPKLSLEAAVADKMSVDRSVDGGQAQTRDQEVLELFPHLFGIRFFGWHGSVQKKNWFLASAQKRKKRPTRKDGVWGTRC